MSSERKIAIVTGASSGIGREIAGALLEREYEVYGIGRKFHEDATVNSECFHAIECDLNETDKLLKYIDEIKKEGMVEVLVNNAGVGYYGLHEELNASKIKELVRTNLEAPMILTNYLLRDLKKNEGWIFNISSVTATKTNPHGCAYGATKAGLTSFSHSLFEEVRKYGVKVVNIQPDMTATDLYRNADFEEADDLMASLSPGEVAELIGYAIDRRQGLVITDLTVRPQLHRIKRKGTSGERK